MTELRDARLRQALDHAPDGDLRPAPVVREAVLRAAHHAVMPSMAPVSRAAPLPWWRRAWQSAGRAGGPWNAALASVLLATVVTLLWWQEPVPDAKPDFKPEAPASMAATAPAPSAATATATAPAPSAAPLPAEPKRPSADRAKSFKAESTRDAPAEALSSASAPAPVTEPALAPPPAPAAAPIQAPAAPAPAPAAAQTLRREGELRANAGAPSSAVGELADRAAAPRASAARAPEPLQLRLNGKPLAFTPDQRQEIESLARMLLAQATGADPLQAPVVAEIDLRGEGAPPGTLQLAPPQIRWMPLRPGATPQTGRPDAAQLQALLDRLAALPSR